MITDRRMITLETLFCIHMWLDICESIAIESVVTEAIVIITGTVILALLGRHTLKASKN